MVDNIKPAQSADTAGPDAPDATVARTIGRGLGAVLGTVTGVASLAYVAGYLNRVSYFATLQNRWLVQFLTPAEIGFSCFRGLYPLVLLVAVGTTEALVTEKQEGRPPHYNRAYWIAAMIAIAFVALDFGGQRWLLIEVRAGFALLASYSLTFAAVFVAKKAVADLVRPRFGTTVRITHAALAMGAIAFVVIPLLAGRSEALSIYAAAAQRLPIARFDSGNHAETLPVIMTTSDRVYCIRIKPSERLSVVIRPVEWARVLEIRGVGGE